MLIDSSYHRHDFTGRPLSPQQNIFFQKWEYTFLAINQWIEWAIPRSIREGLLPKLFEDFAILLLTWWIYFKNIMFCNEISINWILCRMLRDRVLSKMTFKKLSFSGKQTFAKVSFLFSVINKFWTTLSDLREWLQ